MNSEANPFQPPTSSGSIAPTRFRRTRLRDFLIIAWPFIFGANMIVPLLFGWELVEQSGALGVLFASVILLALGWLLFVVWPALALRLTFGAIFTALLQFFPILHMILGIIAFGITLELGQAAEMNDQAMPRITSELGGFIITSIMGCTLLLSATGIGTLFLFIFRWGEPLVGNDTTIEFAPDISASKES
jgi:hypothetical protein